MLNGHRAGVAAIIRARRIIIPMAALAALVPLAVFSAGRASAATSLDYWCDYNGGACLTSRGFDQTVIASGGTLYTQISSGKWDGRYVYEYQQDGTDNCLEFSDATVPSGEVIEDTCSGRASEEWWPSGSGTLVNVFATSSLGAQACLTGDGVGNAVYVGNCDGGVAQYWSF